MKPLRLNLALLCLLATSTLVCAGQSSGSIHGHIFRSDALGLTYTFPENFSAKVESEIPSADPSGREHMILQLWNSPDRDRAAVRQLWAGVRGAKIVGPQKISSPACEMWRVDFFQPDALPRYSAAVVLPLADRRLIAIQINAPSQKELDAEVDSLQGLRLDRK
jgi:hypothetical protein